MLGNRRHCRADDKAEADNPSRTHDVKALMFVLIVAAASPLLYGVVLFNTLIRLRNHCDEAWSNIETELKRRYELIPNLVDTVKGYAAHEKKLLEEVTKWRQACLNDQGSPKHQAATENQLVHVLQPLLARIENYPELKADTNFLELQEELVNTEDRIQAARRFYNGNVRDNNNRVHMFPSNLVAYLFAFDEREFFEIDPAIQRSPSRISVESGILSRRD